jgi:hypothetical protein
MPVQFTVENHCHVAAHAVMSSDDRTRQVKRTSTTHTSERMSDKLGGISLPIRDHTVLRSELGTRIWSDDLNSGIICQLLQSTRLNCMTNQHAAAKSATLRHPERCISCSLHISLVCLVSLSCCHVLHASLPICCNRTRKKGGCTGSPDLVSRHFPRRIESRASTLVWRFESTQACERRQQPPTCLIHRVKSACTRTAVLGARRACKRAVVRLYLPVICGAGVALA